MGKGASPSPFFFAVGKGPMADIEQINRQALADIAAASSPEALEALRVSLLRKQGSVTALLRGLAKLPAEGRKAAGVAINQARDGLGAALAERRRVLEEAALETRLASETIDVTLPGRDPGRGGVHPVSRTIERIADIFARLGYERADGPEIEDDWHNFEALNFPQIGRASCRESESTTGGVVAQRC